MPFARRNLPMKQPGYYTLRGFIAFTLNHLEQRRGRGRQQPIKPLQPFANMLADLFRAPFGIAFANLDRRKKNTGCGPEIAVSCALSVLWAEPAKQL